MQTRRNRNVSPAERKAVSASVGSETRWELMTAACQTFTFIKTGIHLKRPNLRGWNIRTEGQQNEDLYCHKHWILYAILTKPVVVVRGSSALQVSREKSCSLRSSSHLHWLGTLLRSNGTFSPLTLLSNSGGVHVPWEHNCWTVFTLW